MMLDVETSFSSSFIRLVPVGGGKSLLQIKATKDGVAESFPSFLIQGECDASTLASFREAGSLSGVRTKSCDR